MNGSGIEFDDLPVGQRGRVAGVGRRRDQDSLVGVRGLGRLRRSRRTCTVRTRRRPRASSSGCHEWTGSFSVASANSAWSSSSIRSSSSWTSVHTGRIWNDESTTTNTCSVSRTCRRDQGVPTEHDGDDGEPDQQWLHALPAGVEERGDLELDVFLAGVDARRLDERRHPAEFVEIGLEPDRVDRDPQALDHVVDVVERAARRSSARR